MITTTAIDATPSTGYVNDEALLSGVLEEVICAGEGPPALELHRRAVELGRRSRSGDAAAADELAGLVAELDVPQLKLLVRMLTCWHQLMNLAEDNDRVRRLRVRELEQAPAPRRGSLRHAITHLAAGGTSATELHDALARAEVQLVMTAHPTEARRRTTVNKLARVFALLRSLDERIAVPGETQAVRRRMAAAVQELWGTDELRAVSTTVLDEVTAGLIYFTSTLAEVVPAIYRDLDAAVRESYPDDDVVVPPLLTFGSWMGGDRDGNPHVTPRMTATALGLMKTACLTHLEGALTDLSGRITLSERVAASPRSCARCSPAPRPAPTRRSSRSCTSATPRSPTGASSSCSPTASARRARAAKRLPPRRGARRRPARRRDRAAPPEGRLHRRRRGCATSSARSRSSAFTSPAWTCASTPTSTAARSTRSCRRSASRRATPSCPRPSAWPCSRARSPTAGR